MGYDLITKVMSGITTAFNKFVNIFKKNGFVYSLLAMLALICFYTLVINPIRVDKIVEKRFEMMYEQSRKKETDELMEAMNRRLSADMVVGDIMTKLIDKFENIHRVLLLEAHNSIQNHGGVDFLYYSCSMEMLSPNSRHLNYLSEDLQRQVRVNLLGHNMIQTLKHRDFLFYENLSQCKHPDHRLIHKLAFAGDSEAILIPFISAGEPNVILVVSGEQLPVVTIVEYISEFKKQIESSLM